MDEEETVQREQQKAVAAVAEKAKALNSALVEVQAHAQKCEREVGDCHAILRSAVQELVSLRERAGITASHGAALQPHSDSWYYTGRSEAPLPEWLAAVDEQFTPANATLSEQVRSLLARYKAAAASSTADARAMVGQLAETEGALQDARTQASHYRGKTRELTAQLKTVGAELKKVEQSLAGVSAQLEGTQHAALTDRAHLVQSALASLHLLRSHLAHQAGLRQQSTIPLFSKRESALAGVLTNAAMVPGGTALGDTLQLPPSLRPKAVPSVPPDPAQMLPILSPKATAGMPPHSTLAASQYARTLPPNTPPTQANAADTSAGRSPRRKRTAADTDAVCMSADAVSPRPAASSFVATSRTAAEGGDRLFATPRPAAPSARHTPQQHLHNLSSAQAPPPPPQPQHVPGAYMLASGSPGTVTSEWSACVLPDCHHPSLRRAAWHAVQTLEHRAARAIEMQAARLTERHTNAPASIVLRPAANAACSPPNSAATSHHLLAGSMLSAPPEGIKRHPSFLK